MDSLFPFSWPLVRRLRLAAALRDAERLRGKLAKANRWNRNHQLRCERLKGQIRSDQVYIDALEEQLPDHVIERVREAVRPAREEAKAS